MLPSSGNCAFCRDILPVWNYRCTACYFKLHIACASHVPAAGSSHAATCHGSYGGGGGQSDVAATPSRLNAIAKFLLKMTIHIAIDAATGGLASPLAAVLTAALDN
ncbi:unnamed protein product [Urochloa humidicola]